MNGTSGGKEKKFDGPRINGQIRSPEIRLIGDDGHQYGVVSMYEARRIADEQALDLVEISPNANPPVVKLIDYGKFKYQQQKKLSEAKKKQVVVEVKEIKFRPHIDKHDLEVKLKKINEFLDAGDKVKLLMQFRGREIAHKEIGLAKFHEILKDLVQVSEAVIESPLEFQGGKALAMVAPGKKK